jgi:uncharacterized protein YneF (UPF0154 family)
MDSSAAILLSVAYLVFFGAIGYWVIRYAVKHGVRDALKDRDEAKRSAN